MGARVATSHSQIKGFKEGHDVRKIGWQKPYTDPETGKKMEATMNPDGTITTDEVDMKKKKHKEGYGKQGCKPRSLNK